VSMPPTSWSPDDHGGLLDRGDGASVSTRSLGDGRPRRLRAQVQSIFESKRVPRRGHAVHTSSARQLVARDYQAAFVEVDVLARAVSAHAAPPRIDTTSSPSRHMRVHTEGAAEPGRHPSVQLPGGMSGGIPVAIQIMAHPGADALALRVAYHARAGGAREPRAGAAVAARA